jgi:hypothetical protein
MPTLPSLVAVAFLTTAWFTGAAGASPSGDIRLAYLDPGTGSFVIQALLAAVVGLGFTARHHLRRLFRRPGKSEEKPAPAGDPPVEDA